MLSSIYVNYIHDAERKQFFFLFSSFSSDILSFLIKSIYVVRRMKIKKSYCCSFVKRYSLFKSLVDVWTDFVYTIKWTRERKERKIFLLLLRHYWEKDEEEEERGRRYTGLLLRGEGLNWIKNGKKKLYLLPNLL